MLWSTQTVIHARQWQTVTSAMVAHKMIVNMSRCQVGIMPILATNLLAAIQADFSIRLQIRISVLPAFRPVDQTNKNNIPVAKFNMGSRLRNCYDCHQIAQLQNWWLLNWNRCCCQFVLCVRAGFYCCNAFDVLSAKFDRRSSCEGTANKQALL